MNENNIILKMPFDESDGSLIAYDYSHNRADGSVSGARFVDGKNGNAISFSGKDNCELSKSIFSNLNGDFSLMMWVKTTEIELGTPHQLIWILNFSGFKNYSASSYHITPGLWYALAVTRKNGVFTFYINGTKYEQINNNGTLLGISLIQDFYGGDYALGLLDDVFVYDVALTADEIISEMSSKHKQRYLIDDVDLAELGVFVSGSDGVLNRPKSKTPAKISWDNYHGESVDLMHKFIEPREITLSCFIKADSKMDFIRKIMALEALFDKQGTNRLTIDLHPTKPLIYEVYCKDSIEVIKTWSDELMVGTFKLKLTEPEPVKRVLKHYKFGEETKTCTITLSTNKYVNVYWGDGSVQYDICGQNVQLSHNFVEDGNYYPVITGCIDEIIDFSTNAIVVWEKI